MSAAASPAELAALRTVAGTDQEFSFGAADFERVRQLIYQRAGISLHAGKQAMVYSRLSRRLRDTGPRRQGAHGLLPFQAQAFEDRPPSRIGECSEQQVAGVGHRNA